MSFLGLTQSLHRFQTHSLLISCSYSVSKFVADKGLYKAEPLTGRAEPGPTSERQCWTYSDMGFSGAFGKGWHRTQVSSGYWGNQSKMSVLLDRCL